MSYHHDSHHFSALFLCFQISPRPHFPMPMVNTFLDQNGAFCLRAEVLGYPAPSVMFYKDDSDEPLMAQSQLHKTAR